MVIVHLTASPFFGGPERQILGLSRHLPAEFRSVTLCFPERGLCRPFLGELLSHGLEGIALHHNAPRYAAAIAEIADYLHRLKADVLCCHGYKPDLLGLRAGLRARVPVVAVSRGWTAATWKVRLNEFADRRALRSMDEVVCVSNAQADKVRDAGVSPRHVRVIHNAIDADRFANPDPSQRGRLLELFAAPPQQVILAAGRLSPEKGFDQLIAAAAILHPKMPQVGFVVFGDGSQRNSLQRQILQLGLQDHFILAGFRDDLDRFIPAADMVALPSFTEGLPNIALEAAAAGVPIVATAVGGTPEVVADQITGRLVPPRDPSALALAIEKLLADEPLRRRMGLAARDRVLEKFSFPAQTAAYQKLFAQLRPYSSPASDPRIPTASISAS